MPRVYRTQKERERLLIREFVEHLEYRISNPKWRQERPDALLTLVKARKRKRIAIELTDHFSDTIAGRPSSLTPIVQFWALVESSLNRRISHRKHISDIAGTVQFKSKPAFPTEKGKALRSAMQTRAKELAAEIVRYTEAHPVAKRSGWHTFRHRDFVGYPTVQSLLQSLRLSRETDEYIGAVRCNWTCANVTTGHFRLSLDYVKSAIAEKNKKAANYENWGNAEEKWLLIAAGGGNVNTHAPR